ncbi:uncharacterized protein LOC144859437 [Branchiostoma floridae x Branchiostoma japonicum]
MSEPSRHDLFLEISQALEDEEVRDLRNYVGGRKLLPTGRIQHANPHQIFNKLQNDGKMKPGDLSLLAELMRKIGRTEYAEEAERIAANERKDNPNSSQSGTEIPAGSTSPTDAEIREKVRSINYSDTGEVTILGRRIRYNTSMRFEFNLFQMIFYCEAWDVGTGTSDNSGKRESRQGAAEHAIEHLFKRLRGDGVI